MLDIVVPVMGESVAEGSIGSWSKKAGDAVKKDEILVEIETDKVALEVVAPADGVLAEILATDGATVTPGMVIGRVEAGAAASAAAKPAVVPMPTPAPVAAPVAAPAPTAAHDPMPSAARALETAGVAASSVTGSGKDGRITKGDALAAVAALAAAPAPAVAAPSAPRALGAREERVKMTRLRQTIARRLKDAQNTAAMLTTFNEVDMSAVMALRERRKEAFQKKHGVGLGFSSFFVKAVVGALKAFPAINAEIQGDEIIYKHYYDIGIAVGAEGGLVVPVLRDADQRSFAQIEQGIRDFAKRAGDGSLTLDDLKGGTFTITNGGVFGSLMSTPILNPPQVGILGLHKIADRPAVVGGQVVVRPMMYVALSYDHRIVDGREAVQFLVKIKEFIEDPALLLVEG
jgi:2-oxoglutarate dehydrogenase E2 component (dihydrolipoamide succinyltransferase)